jgi:competence ComEA-like helix-hairpin-helix protein
LVDRLDPNTADWQTLAALPGMGEKHARDIVAYRERFTADHPGKLAFTTAEDMLRIRGIGVATLKTLEPHLVFPTP